MAGEGSGGMVKWQEREVEGVVKWQEREVEG